MTTYFNLVIKCTTKSFEIDPTLEVGRILADVSHQMWQGIQDNIIFDKLGNRVGFFEFRDKQTETPNTTTK